MTEPMCGAGRAGHCVTWKFDYCKMCDDNENTPNNIYDRLGLHKWWQDPLPENSIINDLPLRP
jgi:hypothetical protein